MPLPSTSPQELYRQWALCVCDRARMDRRYPGGLLVGTVPKILGVGQWADD